MPEQTRATRRGGREHDRSLLLRAATVVAGAGLALAGCGTVMPGAVVGDRATESAVSATTQGVGPGVTDDTVKVVFVGVDLKGVQKLTGFKTADAGDPEAQVEALEAWVNANGGIAGRQLDAVFRLYDAQNDSPAAEEQLCNKITQDDQAFAVVLTGQFQSNARPCYAQRETLVLDTTLVATDNATYDELSPYLWSPSFPAYDGFVEAFIAALSEQAFFEGRDRVGVVADDSPINRRVVEELATPLLEEAGVEAEIAWVDTTDQGSLFQGNDQAAVTFRSAGHRPGDVPGWGPAGVDLRDRRVGAELHRDLRDVQLRQPVVLRQQPRDHRPRRSSRGWSGSASTPARTWPTTSWPGRRRRPRPSAWRCTPRRASASTRASRRGSRFPTATRRGCSSSARSS